jgi:hypothetical protein
MIYFMQAAEGGPIKIGCTGDVDMRHKELGSTYGRDLIVLATMEGGRQREAEIHARFAHLRLGRTEQFRPELDLMEFIGLPLFVGSNPDAVEAMPAKQASALLTTVKMDAKVVEECRIAAAFRGLSLAEYISETMREAAKRDIDQGYARRAEGGEKAPKKGGKQ